jgi:putative FmdB family regulatory protein
MPIYEYECLECGAHFDRLKRFGDPDPETCPNGHPRVHRLLSQPAIIFKGSGFYVTDNGRSTRSSRNGRKAKKSESTPETKKQTKT